MFKFDDIDINDKKTWQLISRGDTKGVFQLETALGQQWSRALKPSNIEELAALVSLIRPGPLESGMAEQYVKRKKGSEEIAYLSPALEPILESTYGCLVFQEQVLRICMDIAGFTEVEADIARSAVSKKSSKKMNEVYKMFVEGTKKTKIVTKEQAEEIWSWIQKSVRYSFNKSHGASYAITAYQCAYMKTHHPTQFFTAWLSYADMKPDSKQEISDLVQNARIRNIEVFPPNIIRKNVNFEIIEDKQISFGISHIKNVGTTSIKKIKSKKTNLSSFTELIGNVKGLKRNVVESLIKAGACDSYELGRNQMLKMVRAVFGYNNKEKIEAKPLTKKELSCFMEYYRQLGISGALNNIIQTKACTKPRIPVIEAKIAWLNQETEDTNRQKSIWEKLYLGLNLTCSAADDVEQIEKNIKTCKEFHSMLPKDNVTLHVVVDKIRPRVTSEKAKNPGQEYVYISISDNSGTINDVVIWPNIYKNIKETLSEDCVMSIKGIVEMWKGRRQVNVKTIEVIG